MYKPGYFKCVFMQADAEFQSSEKPTCPYK